MNTTTQMPTSELNAAQGDAYVDCLQVQRVRLDRQGYEMGRGGGQYFGTGEPVYRAVMELYVDQKFIDVRTFEFRAYNRQEAKDRIVEFIKYNSTLHIGKHDIRWRVNLGKRMRDAYNFAERNPGWHSFSKTARKAVKRLERIGYVVINKKWAILC